MNKVSFFIIRVAVLIGGIFALNPFFKEGGAGVFQGNDLVQDFFDRLNNPKTYVLLVFVFILSFLLEKDQFLKHTAEHGKWFTPFGIFISYFVIGAIVFLLA